MSKEAELKVLKQQLRSGNSAVTVEAVKILREKGWLEDGSLRRANLYGANLSYVNLDGANLSEADLRGATLIETKLHGANLSGIILSAGNLTNTDLMEAELNASYLRGRGANLHRADLRGANLSEADLRGVTLSKADLRGADLSRTTLSAVNLTNADLSEADLSGSDLRHTDLSDVDLRGANLSEANLRDANLTGADLREADLSAAVCCTTVFADVDLSAAIGLESVHHHGPSAISIQALYASKGRIPEVFLRGCGVPEEFITSIPALTANQFYPCFVSYSHLDQSFACRLYDALQKRGIRCWFDNHQMNLSGDLYGKCDRGTRVLVCISKNALTSGWVDNELDTLFEKEHQLMKARGDNKLACIALDLDGYLFSDDYQSGEKQQLQSRLAADFNGWERDNAIFEREIERVINALRTDGGKEIPPPSNL